MPFTVNSDVKFERVIDFDILLQEAENHRDVGDYQWAERTYITIAENLKYSDRKSEIVPKVKEGLISVYESWAYSKIKNRSYADAEKLLYKSIRVGGKTKRVLCIYVELYTEWGDGYKESKKYLNAEKYHIKALKYDKEACAGSSDKIKNKLKDIYAALSKNYIDQLDYHEAELYLQKQLLISDDKEAVKRELITLYNSWALTICTRDRNWKGAIILYVKKWKLEHEIGENTDDNTAKTLCYWSYSSKDKLLRKKADQIYLSFKKHRIFLLLSAIVLSLVAILTPIFSPYSMGVYIFSYVFMSFDEINCVMDTDSHLKEIRNCVILTFASLVWFFLIVAFAPSGGEIGDSTGYSIFIMITYVMLVVLDVRVLIVAINRFRKYYSYQKQPLPDIINNLLPSKTLNCKSCGEKLKIAGDNISTVKCSKCGSIVREALDLSIKNKPVILPKDKTKQNYDWGYAWRKAGLLAGRAIVKEIIKNIRF